MADLRSGLIDIECSYRFGFYREPAQANLVIGFGDLSVKLVHSKNTRFQSSRDDDDLIASRLRIKKDLLLE